MGNLVADAMLDKYEEADAAHHQLRWPAGGHLPLAAVRR